MSYKVGEQIKYVGEVRENGVLQNISTWPITAQARKDNETGPLLGNFTKSLPGTGLFQLVLDTTGFAPCQVFVDVRMVRPDGTVCYTDTDKFALSKAVTVP